MSKTPVADVVACDSPEGDPTELRNHPDSFWPLPEHTRWLRDCFYQHFFTTQMEEFFAELRGPLNLLLHAGGVSSIHVGCTPFRDTALEENQAALNAAVAGLEGGFSAEVWNGIADSDGLLSTEEPVVFHPLLEGGIQFERRLVGVPIEIGQTRPKTTARHMAPSQALARWPYGYDRMWVLALDPARVMSPAERMERVLFRAIHGEKS
jgi:hypothetical protein